MIEPDETETDVLIGLLFTLGPAALILLCVWIGHLIRERLGTLATLP